LGGKKKKKSASPFGKRKKTARGAISAVRKGKKKKRGERYFGSCESVLRKGKAMAFLGVKKRKVSPDPLVEGGEGGVQRLVTCSDGVFFCLGTDPVPAVWGERGREVSDCRKRERRKGGGRDGKFCRRVDHPRRGGRGGTCSVISPVPKKKSHVSIWRGKKGGKGKKRLDLGSRVLALALANGCGDFASAEGKRRWKPTFISKKRGKKGGVRCVEEARWSSCLSPHTLGRGRLCKSHSGGKEERAVATRGGKS